MLFHEELTAFLILAAYFGFVGLWGSLLARDRWQKRWVIVGFGFLFVIPLSLFLPWGYIEKVLIWALALVLIAIFILHPAIFPGWLWEWRFMLGYFSLLMFLIMVWAIFSGQSFLWLWMGIPACYTGFLGVIRVFMEQEEPASRLNHESLHR